MTKAIVEKLCRAICEQQVPMWTCFYQEVEAVLDALLEPSGETVVEYYTASDTLLSVKGWRAAMLHMRRMDK